MTTIVQAMNEGFIEALSAAFVSRFCVFITSERDDNRAGVVHKRIDGVTMTAEQAEFIVAFDIGYTAATIIARDA